MDNYTITKKQIGILSNTSLEAFHYLNEEFPDAFKTELEVGKWYIAGGCSTNGYLILATEITDHNEVRSNCWFTPGKNYIDKMGLFERIERLATHEEVEEALIVQSKKLGIKEGVYVNRNLMHANTDNVIISKGEKYFYDSHCDILYLNEKEIYSNGVFAKVIPQEKTVVPMSKALKIIAKKMNVSPENIEIKP